MVQLKLDAEEARPLLPSGLQFCYYIQPNKPALRENLGFRFTAL